MDRKYLEEYEQHELEQYEKLVVKPFEEGTFSFTKDRYPPNDRFVRLRHPVTDTTSIGCDAGDRWTQVPFSGSTVILLPAISPSAFEECFFKTSEIPRIIDFIKETGRLQFTLQEPPTSYAGLDYLDPIFKELEPPHIKGVPQITFGTEKEIQIARDSFYTLAEIRFADFFAYVQQKVDALTFNSQAQRFHSWSLVYSFLKLRGYSIAEDIENTLVDNPPKALLMLMTCASFIADPFNGLRFDSLTHSMEEIRLSQTHLPQNLRPEVLSFPCEIGKFLFEKLTYAPKGIRACNELIDHYAAYDLQKVQEALNNAIRANHPDNVNINVEALTEILDNIWNDKTITRKVKGLKIGLPIAMAAIGNVAAGPIGATGGFLTGLGFDVMSKTIDIGTDELSEKVAKLGTRNYQANIYDFKKKYKHQIVDDKKSKRS